MRPPAPQASGPDTSGGGCRRPVQCRTPLGDGYHGGHGGAPRRARAGGALGRRVRRLGAPGALPRCAPLHLRGECACSVHRPPESPSRSPRIDCFAALIDSCREPGELVNSAASLLTTTFGSLISGLLLLIFCGFLFLLVLNSSALLCACMV